MANDERKEKVAALLADQVELARLFAEKQEEVRAQVEEAVKKSIAEHDEQEVQALPNAQKALKEVVIPWWRDFESSGLLTQSLDAIRGRVPVNVRGLFLAETIKHSSPAHQRAEWVEAQEEGRKPFDYVFKGLKNLFELTEKDVSNSWVVKGTDTTWDFSIGPATPYQGGHQPQPGFYVSTFHRGYDGGWEIAPIPLHEPTSVFRVAEPVVDLDRGWSRAKARITPVVEPTVLLRFADQIRTGRVWEVLERSIQKALDPIPRVQH